MNTLIPLGLNEVIPQYTSQAESNLANFFNTSKMNLIHEKFNELVIISKTNMKAVKKHYGLTSEAYRGHLAEVISKLKETTYTTEIALLNKVIELKDKDILIGKKDVLLGKKDMIIKDLKKTIKDQKN
jgi:hypothetical protein